MTKQRKKDHIEICLHKDIQKGKTGLNEYSFNHCALPEINFEKISTNTNFLDKSISAPIIISALTGGTNQAKEINKNLASAAQSLNIAMGVGSQRVAIENPELENTFRVRKYARDIPLLANLGVVQFNYGYGVKECQKAIDMISADGLFLHLNPLQEVIQLEGDKNFSNLIRKIKKVNDKLKEPILIKEVGTGISSQVANKLFENGIKIIDVAGYGGTNWALIEGLRRRKIKKLGKIFSNWGIPTAECIVECSKIKGLSIIASGGIRTGIDIAKAIALGADLVSLALPLLSPSSKSEEAVKEKLEELILQLKIAMFCVGASDIEELKEVKLNNLSKN